MLKRDFILVQIEELGKMIASLAVRRDDSDGAVRRAETLQRIFRSLGAGPGELLAETPEVLRCRMDDGGRSGIMRLEIAAKALTEASFEQPEQAEAFLRKAKEILLYAQQHDNTFSLDRIAAINRIDSLLP